ncbi:hypothetical protein I5535_00515 [Rhodobacteraceae bacterium F11138]|nr:hypothetical protein [Rhodobacteraceae bacterium F11138]
MVGLIVLADGPSAAEHLAIYIQSPERQAIWLVLGFRHRSGPGPDEPAVVSAARPN